ncbi:MAG: DeoR/GlpR transcriptional regulator [Planctomycetaceae bacterium]|nr:MAG: DeoR/GlpR transcriptional regulator [Planctomycetaceae bacterium]
MIAVSEQRRGELRRIVQTRGFASLAELADSLSVSESTVRRDVDLLERLGEAKRTHGGVFWTGSADKMRVFDSRGDHSAAQKRGIAVAAAAQIHDGETVLLDGGSTTYEIARQLVIRRLQVVTNSLPVANLLSGCSNIELVLIGGNVDHRTGVTIGPMADSLLSSLRVDRAFLSVAGVDAEGYYNSNLLLVETERMMSRIAAVNCIVADSSKFGRASLSRLCGLGEVDGVITDKRLTTDWQNRLQTAGVELTLADET